MSERLSTGYRNLILGGWSAREIFKDARMDIYSGSQPASADDAVTGVLLASISKSSGAVSVGEYSVPSRWSVTIPGAHASGTYSLHVVIDGVSYTCTYNTEESGSEGHADNDAIARGLAREVVMGCPQVFAIAEGANSKLYIQARIPGIDLDVHDGGGTVTIVTFAEILAETAADTIRFALPASGAMSKDSSTWSDVVLVSGVAGYFRVVDSHDDGTYSLTQPRLQGAVSTSGAELNLSSTSLVLGTTLTIDTYSISQPAE